jgi:myo-inositol-1(or 4)-monophosphatase
VHSLQADLELLTSAARDAGALALTFFRNSPNAWSKTGGSPVTDADVAVDEYLRVKLLAERPHYGWLSEETADDPARLSRETIFAVDPIDGTRGFIEGDDRWCVSLALVRRGRPVAAALFAAARAELYSAAEGGGAFLGATRLAVTDRLALAGARITGPRGWLKTAAIVAAGAELQPHIPSLAYRLTSVSAAALTAPSPARAPTTGTLRLATFWCTKRAAGSPGSMGRRSATIRKFRATARWQRQIQRFSRFSSRGWPKPGRKSRDGEGEEFF